MPISNIIQKSHCYMDMPRRYLGSAASSQRLAHESISPSGLVFLKPFASQKLGLGDMFRSQPASEVPPPSRWRAAHRPYQEKVFSCSLCLATEIGMGSCDLLNIHTVQRCGRACKPLRPPMVRGECANDYDHQRYVASRIGPTSAHLYNSTFSVRVF